MAVPLVLRFLEIKDGVIGRGWKARFGIIAQGSLNLRIGKTAVGGADGRDLAKERAVDHVCAYVSRQGLAAK